MKKLLILAIAIGLRCMFYSTSADAAYSSVIGKTKAVSKQGVMSLSGTILIDTFSVSGATPTLQLGTYVRSNGYTKGASYTATGYRSGGTVSNSPQVSISAFTDTSVSLVISQQNTATVSILGINVLSGLPQILVPDPNNVKIVLSTYLY